VVKQYINNDKCQFNPYVPRLCFRPLMPRSFLRDHCIVLLIKNILFYFLTQNCYCTVLLQFLEVHLYCYRCWQIAVSRGWCFPRGNYIMQFLFRVFHGHNARVSVYRGALYTYIYIYIYLFICTQCCFSKKKK
jgi:hypothetical protein